MVGYWFKSSILSFILFLIPVISFSQPNKDKYTLNITCSNAVIRSIVVEQEPIKKEFPSDISYLVNNKNPDRPYFSIQFGIDKMNLGAYIVILEIYKNNVLINSLIHESQAFDSTDKTNRLRAASLFLVDK